MTSSRRTRRRRASVATRLALAALAVCLVAIVVTFVVGVTAGRSSDTEVVEQRLEAVRGAKVVAVRSFVASLEANTAVLAASPMTVDALASFSRAYDDVDPATPRAADEVTAWYRDTFLPALADADGRQSALSTVVPSTPTAIALQHAYTITAEPPPLSSVDDAGDGSAWSAVHRDYHATFRQAADALGVADLYLIDGRGRVVYSVSKRPDFATDLRVGPYSGTPLARLVDEARTAGANHAIADLTRYAPALNQPSGFVASAVHDVRGGFVGVVAVQFSSTALGAVASGDGMWVEDGLGDTGETVVVGTDRRLRTDPRAFVESPAEYLEVTVERGILSAREAATVRSSGTTALVQTVDGGVIERADGAVGISAGSDELGRPVLMAFAPADIGGLDWIVLTRIAEDEVQAPFVDFRDDLIRVVAVVVAVLTVLAVIWANWIVRPIRLIGDRLAASGDAAADSATTAAGPVEFGRLARSFELMDERLRRRRDEVERVTAERSELLQSILPPAVAARVANGDRDVFDKVPDASVAVVVVAGVDDLVRGGSAMRARVGIDEIVAALDEVAARYGLERVKIIGDMYVAACGHREPLLDHARRAVGFAHGALQAVRSLAASHAHLPAGMDAAAAVHSGPVDIGLSGRTRLVYDVWGDTVSECVLLGRSARRGHVLVAPAAYDRLPAEVVDGAVQETIGAVTAWRFALPATTIPTGGGAAGGDSDG